MVRRKYWYSAGLILVIVLVYGLSSQGGLGIADDDSRLSLDRPNIVVVDVDRITPFRMPCYGYSRNTTPVMCGVAEEGVLFENAIAQTGWTAGSIASLFTSLYPGVHRVVKTTGRLTDRAVTVAEVLQQRGYDTAAFPARKGENRPELLGKRYNLGQGFDVYAAAGSDFEQTVPAAIRWVRNRSGDPFFLFVQGFELHKYSHLPEYFNPTIPAIPSIAEKYMGNYTGVFTNTSLLWWLEKQTRDDGGLLPRIKLTHTGFEIRLEDRRIPLSEKDIAYMKTYYDASARYADRLIGRLIDVLREEGVYEDTILVITASHGESLSPQGRSGRIFSHGRLFEGSIHVPLIIRVPGIEAQRVSRQVELIDVMPTLFDISGINDTVFAEQQQGESILPQLVGSAANTNPFVFSEGMHLRSRAVRTERWKLIDRSQDIGSDDLLYAIDEGRTGNRNFAVDRPDVVREMEEHLSSFDRRNKEKRVWLLQR